MSYVASLWDWLKRLNLATVRDNFEQSVNLVSDPLWQFFYIVFSNDDCCRLIKLIPLNTWQNSIAESKIKNQKLPATKKAQVNNFLLGCHQFVLKKNTKETFLCYRFGGEGLYVSLGTNPSWMLTYTTENKEMSMFSSRKNYFNW